MRQNQNQTLRPRATSSSFPSPMSKSELWSTDLARISAEAGLLPPPLHIEVKKKTNAWAGRKGITVTEDMLAAPDAVRLYLIAHELGHIAKRHFRLSYIVRAAFGGVVALFLSQVLLFHATPQQLNLSSALLAVIGIGIPPFYLRNEVDADRFAVRCIGVQMCIEGSTEMGRLSGTLRTWERRIKLGALSRIAARVNN
jgi:Zn-dependent protease with chaperone function